MRWYAQDEVNQEDSEQNEVDRVKKGYDSLTQHLGHQLLTDRLKYKVTHLIHHGPSLLTPFSVVTGHTSHDCHLAVKLRRTYATGTSTSTVLTQSSSSSSNSSLWSAASLLTPSRNIHHHLHSAPDVQRPTYSIMWCDPAGHSVGSWRHSRLTLNQPETNLQYHVMW